MDTSQIIGLTVVIIVLAYAAYKLVTMDSKFKKEYDIK